MKSRFKSLWLLLGTAIFVMVAVGCNDTLRQFIVPVPSPTGDPGTLAHAITLSTNPIVPTPAISADGSDLHIDVSGDTNAGIVPVGINPVFLGKTSNRVFIINSGDASTPPTVSIYIALLPQSATVSTVTLPATSLGPIAGATSSSNNIYIANRISNNVDVISASVLAVTTTLSVGTEPVMIAGNTANNKVFVVNHGSNNVTEISTIDDSVVKTIPVGSQPIWGVMSTDGLFVFVVNQGDGTVSVIDTSLEIVIATIAVGPSPNFAFYESKLKRVYVSNTGNNTISVIKANGIDLGSIPQVLPVKLADITLSGSPTSVTALSDGTRAYAALGNCPAGVNHTTILTAAPSCAGNLVSVIDVVGLRESGTITVGAGAISLDASGDASRVFVISANDVTTVRDDVHRPNCPASETDCLPGSPLPDRTFTTPSISIIRTTTNTVVATPVNAGIVSRPLPTFHVPQQDPKCVPAIDPNFNDDVALPCAAQKPFVVRTFP
ncbi:MAG: YncE family protein [Acidobacteriia bacterium]|nr:YncE family protein [Terriglobia bacterium]